MGSIDQTRTGKVSAMVPLRYPAFRILWLVWLSANTCNWMTDVTSAWLMTSLTRDPLMIALVQTAAALPVFSFGIASGVLADTVDRRRYLIGAQCWVTAVGTLLLVATLTGVLTPVLLLVLTFANGIGMAMRWPVTAALTSELVPRDQLSAAVALNGVALNASRIVGPALAGALLAQAGSEAVFMLNVLASLTAGVALARWKRPPAKRVLPPERFTSALRVGIRYVFHSSRARYSLVRSSLFSAQAITLFALAPLIAIRFENADAKTYTFLLAAMGVGAIAIAMKLPALRRRFSTDDLVVYGTLISASMTFVVAWATHLALAAVAMMFAGMAFVTVLNTLHVVAQLAFPNWVRARGMAWVQMATMGGSAFGAAVWGKVAAWADLQTSLVASALMAMLGLWLTRRLRVDRYPDESLEASKGTFEDAPVLCAAPDQGPIVVATQYVVEPSRLVEFAQVMRESRTHYLKNGVLTWNLFADLSQPNAYIEQFTDESWAEHMRRIERKTEAEVALTRRKNALHAGALPPRISRYAAHRPEDLGSRG